MKLLHYGLGIVGLFCTFRITLAQGMPLYQVVGLGSHSEGYILSFVILLSFFIELFIMFKLVTDSSALKIFLATLSMKVVSTVLVLPVIVLILWLVLSPIYLILGDPTLLLSGPLLGVLGLTFMLPHDPLLDLVALIITVFIIVIIERYIARLFFRNINLKRLTKWLILIHSISALFIFSTTSNVF